MSTAREAAVGFDPAAPETLFAKLKPGPGLSPAEVADNQRARIRQAMLEAVAEKGYEAVTMRELARLAGVSTRTLYQHYPNKEECFLHMYQLIMGRWLLSLPDPEHGHCDVQRLFRAFRALTEEWGRDPLASRLAMIEVHAAGPTARQQAHRAGRALEARMAELFERREDGEEVPPLLIEAVVTGALGVVRSLLLAGQEQRFFTLNAALSSWALACSRASFDELRELDRVVRPRLVGPFDDGGVATSDSNLFFAAVGKLATSKKIGALTLREILAAAGVPRRAFYSNFSGVDDCLERIFEAQAAAAMKHMARSAATSSTLPGRVYWAINALCSRIASDPMFASLCFGEVGSLGLLGMECRERFMAGARSIVIEAGLSTEWPDQQVEVEASVAAIWGILERKVVAGQARQVPGIAGALTYILLAPSTEPAAAIEAIRREQTKRGQS